MGKKGVFSLLLSSSWNEVEKAGIFSSWGIQNKEKILRKIKVFWGSGFKMKKAFWVPRFFLPKKKKERRGFLQGLEK